MVTMSTGQGYPPRAEPCDGLTSPKQTPSAQTVVLHRRHLLCAALTLFLLLTYFAAGLGSNTILGFGDGTQTTHASGSEGSSGSGSGGTAVIGETPGGGKSGSEDNGEQLAPMTFEPIQRGGKGAGTLPPGVKSESSALEFAPNSKPILLWERTKPAGEQPPRASTQQLPRKARMACMYAGFLRNFEWMLARCREMQNSKFCSFPACDKLFGKQRERLLETTNCDVYISTWHLRGTGRWNTNTYSEKEIVPINRVMSLYQKWIYALHVQNYSLYAPIWQEMHLWPRMFPESRPGQVINAGDQRTARWTGVAVTRKYLRLNDYSQAYKHWCVLQLVLRSGIDYDVYFRLRTDLRFTRTMAAPMVTAATMNGSKSVATKVEFTLEWKNGTRSLHKVTPSRLHVNNYDVADFGFLGLPPVIHELSDRIWQYCLATPDPKAQKVKLVRHAWVSEYNLMLWRIIFDEKWKVDSGYRYLWVSRSNDHCKKKKADRLKAKAEAAAAARARAAAGGGGAVVPAGGITSTDDDD
jgi:hypothetical protein